MACAFFFSAHRFQIIGKGPWRKLNGRKVNQTAMLCPASRICAKEQCLESFYSHRPPKPARNTVMGWLEKKGSWILTRTLKLSQECQKLAFLCRKLKCMFSPKYSEEKTYISNSVDNILKSGVQTLLSLAIARAKNKSLTLPQPIKDSNFT